MGQEIDGKLRQESGLTRTTCSGEDGQLTFSKAFQSLVIEFEILRLGSLQEIDIHVPVKDAVFDV